MQQQPLPVIKYESGKMTVINKMTFIKRMLLNMLADAHLNYWSLPTDVRDLIRVALAYYVLDLNTDWLWSLLTDDLWSAEKATTWDRKNSSERRLRFTLRRDPVHAGKDVAGPGLTFEFVIRDISFMYEGATITVRIFEPF